MTRADSGRRPPVPAVIPRQILPSGSRFAGRRARHRGPGQGPGAYRRKSRRDVCTRRAPEASAPS